MSILAIIFNSKRYDVELLKAHALQSPVIKTPEVEVIDNKQIFDWEHDVLTMFNGKYFRIGRGTPGPNVKTYLMSRVAMRNSLKVIPHVNRFGINHS